MSIQNFLLPLFHIFNLVLNCSGTSNFCATCNCCLPNQVQLGAASTDQTAGAELLAGNEFLTRQNDAALVPSNPKPLVPDKFYKIEFKQSDKENHQFGVPTKLALGSLLQMPTKPMLGEALPSQAILFPVPVATLIFQHPIVPKCNYDTSSTTTTTTTTNASLTTVGSARCVKCRDEGEHEEAQEEKVGDECAGVDAENVGKLDDAECQSKEQQDKEGSSREEETAPAEHSEADDCQSCGGEGCCHEEKAKGEEEEENTQSTTTPPTTTMEIPLEDQKIPLEIFKKFVAKNMGFAPPKVQQPPVDAGKPRDESFENLKDRLKEISNKMDLLKNLSLEMKYPHQQQQRLFPLARFGDLNRNRLLMGGGWQNFGPNRDPTTVPMEGRAYGGSTLYSGSGASSNQQQQGQQPPSFSPPQQQQFQQFQRQVPLQQQQNGMHQFGPIFSSDVPSAGVGKAAIKLDWPRNGTHEAVEEKHPIRSTTFTTTTTTTTTQMSTASTKLNHQQFLLNAIEEFLRESQKIRQMTIGNTILGKLKEEEATAGHYDRNETEEAHTAESVQNKTESVESTEANTPVATPPLTTTITTKVETAATVPATPPCPSTEATTPTATAAIPTTTSLASEVPNNRTVSLTSIEETNANNQTDQTSIAAIQQNGTDTQQQQEQPTPGPFNAQEWMVSSSTTSAAPENVPQMAQFPPQQMPPVNQQNEPEKTAQMNMAGGEAIAISNSTSNSNQTAGQSTIGQVPQNDQQFMGELRSFVDEGKNSSSQSDLKSAQQKQAEIAVDEDAPSESVWQQKNGTHARLINLISSLSGGPHEDSEENGNASLFGQRQEENNESGSELPKFLSTRHIKRDEADGGDDEEDIIDSGGSSLEANGFCSFYRLILFALLQLLYFFIN